MGRPKKPETTPEPTLQEQYDKLNAAWFDLKNRLARANSKPGDLYRKAALEVLMGTLLLKMDGTID